jgi:hypothetical protein
MNPGAPDFFRNAAHCRGTQSKEVYMTQYEIGAQFWTLVFALGVLAPLVALVLHETIESVASLFGREGPLDSSVSAPPSRPTPSHPGY